MIPISGLIFTNDHIDTARQYRDQMPFSAAWSAFDALSGAALTADPLQAAVYDALRWLLLEDADAGTHAVTTLSGNVFSSGDSDVESYRRAFAAVQAITALSGHPALTEIERARVLDAWLAHLDDLTVSQSPHIRAWSALTELCAGIIVGQPERAEMAAAGFRALIDTVQPHGYIAALVAEKDGQSLTRTLQLVQALTLTAEVGAHHGFDLWGYEQRGVSVMTAALYPLYYFYYPEKWPWDAKAVEELPTQKRRSRRERAAQTLSDYTIETAQPLFRKYGSFLELINRRAASPIRAVTLILDELRPIVDLLGGGPVTITHAPAPPPKRRGLFGR